MRPGRAEPTAGGERTPRLAATCDAAQLALTPAEGYLLSRIDGRTPLALLRQIGGLPPGEVERCLERWVKQGVVEWEGALAAAAAPTQPASDEFDASLDLPIEMQERVVEFEARLDRPYHEILGVARDADARVIKHAYFGLSKQFHPDRYFRRNLGPFGPRIERIFKKVLEAYELLSDPATRSEVQREGAGAASGPGAATVNPGVSAVRRLQSRLSTLAKHRRALDDRARKAKGFFESGMAAFKQERWLEAAGSVRLAIAFDPGNEAYKGAFVDVQRRAHEERARVLLREADGAMELGDYKEALRAYEEALHYRAFDADLNHKTARLAWRLGTDLRRAKEYAQAACELEPEKAIHHRTLGQIFKAAGLAANARRELQAALRLDPNDREARQELKSL